MNGFNIAFYLTFFIIALEIVKMTIRNLKKSKIVFITQLGILAVISLIIIGYVENKIFIIIPILLFIPIIIDWIEANKNINLLIPKIIAVLSLMIVGICFIVYGVVRV